MGRRKFRLVVRKNGEREKHAAVTATSLVVSIPRSKLPAQNLDSMKSQLSSCNVLPHSWITQATAGIEAAASKIVLCCLETASETPVIRHSITIREDFTWLVSVYSHSVTPQSCHALAELPVRLDSVDKIKDVVSTIEHSRICDGNSESKFLDVAKRRDGVFKDHSGKADIVKLLSHIAL